MAKTKETKEMTKKLQLGFSAIDPFIQDNIIKSDEREIRGYGFIEWGTANSYPSYLYDLYNNVATLRSLIDGTKNYIVGDSVSSNIPNLSDRQARELVDAIAFDILVYGGTAINVVRNKLGDIAVARPLDMRNVRSDKTNKLIFYSEDFNNKRSYGRAKYTEYPAFSDDRKYDTSILFAKNTRYQTYPSPLWASVTMACEIEKSVNEYHLNAIKNGFSPSVLISFNNGMPDDEQREEIEKNFNEKFSGQENAGTFVLSFNDDKDHSPTIDPINVEDFGDKYQELVKRTRQELFTAFRATPNLFGIMTENLGFNQEEYDSAFKLFNRTVVQPLQQDVLAIIDRIYDKEGCVTIEPFTLNLNSDEEEEQVEEVKTNEIVTDENNG